MKVVESNDLFEYLKETIPEFSDPHQIKLLYGDFSHLRYTNPESWFRKISIWKKTLTLAAQKGFLGSSIFSVNHSVLSACLEYHGIQPLCLKHVIDSINNPNELKNDGLLSYISEILSTLFISSKIQNPNHDDIITFRWILIDESKHLSSIMSCISGLECIMSKKDLLDLINKDRKARGFKEVLSDIDLNELVKAILEEKCLKEYIIDHNGEKKNFYLTPGLSIHERVASDILQLKEAKALLIHSIMRLEEKVFEQKVRKNNISLVNNAKADIANANKQLQNIELIMTKIELSLMNKETIKALETGNAVLKALTSEFSINNIEDLMTEINESVQKVDEMNECISTATKYIMDDSSIQEEFECLLNEEVVEQSVSRQEEAKKSEKYYQNITGIKRNKVPELSS